MFKMSGLNYLSFFTCVFIQSFHVITSKNYAYWCKIVTFIALWKNRPSRRNRLIVSKVPGTPLPMHARTQQNSCVSPRLQEWAVSSRTTWDLRPTARLLAVIVLIRWNNKSDRKGLSFLFSQSVFSKQNDWALNVQRATDINAMVGLARFLLPDFRSLLCKVEKCFVSCGNEIDCYACARLCEKTVK